MVRKLAIRVAARVEWAVIVPVFSRRPLDRCSITMDPMILAAVGNYSRLGSVVVGGRLGRLRAPGGLPRSAGQQASGGLGQRTEYVALLSMELLGCWHARYCSRHVITNGADWAAGVPAETGIKNQTYREDLSRWICISKARSF
jgi:hypothetical protein